MAQFNPREFVVCGDNSQYYSYDGELYTDTFPIEWAENHLPETGPKDCKNCNYFGSWNGVFIGYCLNCSKNDYKYKRGWGFGSLGVVGWERYIEDVDEDKEVALNGLEASNTYLKDINFNDIGDKEIMDSAAVHGIYGEEKEADPEELTEEEFNLAVEEYYTSLYNQEFDEFIANEEENLTQEDLDYIEYCKERVNDNRDDSERFGYCRSRSNTDDTIGNAISDEADGYNKAINDAYEEYQAEIEREDCKEFPEVCENLYNGYESH